MIDALRYLRAFGSFCLFVLMMIVAIHHETTVYLLYQAKGQSALLFHTMSLADFEATRSLTQKQKENIVLTARIKTFSVDSLAYRPTKNYNSIYDQKNGATLWVITACKPYEFSLFEWKFPLVGKVSYKGFFKKDLAIREYNHLLVQGYDVDLRTVSAWSTLGWFSDPLLSGMLDRSKGGLCNLLFHELFHATYYAPSSVQFNENIASFIAHKATLRFLRSDTSALREYTNNHNDNIVYGAYMLRKIDFLQEYYRQIGSRPDRYLLKLKAIFSICDSVRKLPLSNPRRYVSRNDEIQKFKNAYFVDFLQYESIQDSLEDVFNKIYRGNIEKLVQDLKLE